MNSQALAPHKMRHRRTIFLASLLCLGTSLSSIALAQDDELLDLSLEALMDTPVVSLSKRSQSIATAPSAVYVITQEELRNSGATNIPDALRMVPGLTVARIDANKWAVSSRGFNGRFANKLLVMIDGRTVYNPAFSGVYWENNDVVLEDIERIEVIRGPGATIWGANAVNGVINIITYHTADTQGGVAVARVGNNESGFSGRYGAKLAEGTYGRFYAKAHENDEFKTLSGQDSGDDWDTQRLGFRIDSQRSKKSALMLQGEIHQGEFNQTLRTPSFIPPSYTLEVDDTAEAKSGHLLARWDYTQSPDSYWSLQGYYDYFDRDELFYEENRKTFDLDLTHNLRLNNNHQLVWGLGYRFLSDEIGNREIIQTDVSERDLHLYSAFIQDQITLQPERLFLTLGTKIEHNEYTDFEIQPSARLSWNIDESNYAWAAVSRAIRTPSRAERDYDVFASVNPPNALNPSPFILELIAAGSTTMDSEEMTAYELGYRSVLSQNMTLDAALFYNDYSNLRFFDFSSAPSVSFDPYFHLIQEAMFSNGVNGSTHGIELSTNWQVNPDLRFELAYSYQKTDIDWLSVTDVTQNTDAPEHQLSLRSHQVLSSDLTLDLWLRYVDSIDLFATGYSTEIIKIDDYLNLDARIAWKPRSGVELSLVGQNLFDSQQLEYIQETLINPTEVERSVYLQLRMDF